MITTYRLGMGTNYRLGIHRYSCGPPLFTTYCLGVQRYPCGPPLFNTYRLGMCTNYRSTCAWEMSGYYVARVLCLHIWHYMQHWL